MQVNRGKRITWIAASITVVVLLAIGLAAAFGVFSGKEADPYRQNSSQQSSETADDSEAPSNSQAAEDSNNEGEASDTSGDGAGNDATVDPSTVATIDIESMGITVAYVKGVGGFEYEIIRTSGGTRYAEFRNADLIGTKCTNDQGAFASIIENPTATEDATISKRVTLGEVSYGLSLAGTNCTGNADLLARYQKSFSDAFSLLKKTDSN